MAGKREVKNRKSGDPLVNPQQELFCRLFASDVEFFGNGVKSYLKAFVRPPGRPPLSYTVAKSNAWDLLSKPYILKRIDELLDIHINDQIVDKNLGIVILQNADYRAKVQAIKEHNALKKRISKTVDIDPDGSGEILRITINKPDAKPKTR